MADALAALNADPKLNMARFYLVPTYIKEEEFWRNWFYRVQIILSAFGIEMPKAGTYGQSTFPSENTTVLSEEERLHNDVEKELGTLGIHSPESNPEAWEEELKRELSSLDPSKEGPDSLLAQNWEEELMLELGLKDTTATPLPTTLNPHESSELNLANTAGASSIETSAPDVLNPSNLVTE